MDAVVFLLILLVCSCVLSVWTASSVRSDRKRLAMLEGVVTNQGNVLASFSSSAGASPTSAPAPVDLSAALSGVDGASLANAASVLENASPEDVAAAADIIKKLGL